MNIFTLTEYDYDGNSWSLWMHKTKEKEQFVEDCQWIVKTHLELLFKAEEEGFYKRIGSEEVINLIREYLPKLGYENTRAWDYGFRWQIRAEEILEEIVDESTLSKLKQHNKKAFKK